MASAMPVLPLVGSTIVVSPGLMRPASLGRVDHREADAVLDAAAGVEGLELADDGRAGPLGDARSFTSGVPPISAEMLSAIFMLLLLCRVTQSDSVHGSVGVLQQLTLGQVGDGGAERTSS